MNMLYPVTSYVVFAECFRLAKWNSTGCLKNVMGQGSSFNGMIVGQPRKIGGFGSTRHGGTTDKSWDVVGDSQQVSAMDQKL